MNDIQSLSDKLEAIESNIARLSLIEDARSVDPSTVKTNLFVDPFFDDDMRDLGITQNALIMNEALTPHISWTQQVAYEREGSTLLPYTENIFIDQSSSTDERKVNEYAWMAGEPAKVTLSPASYQWISSTVFNTIWANSFPFWLNGLPRDWLTGDQLNGRSVTTTSSTSISSASVVIPSINISVKAEKFNAGELVDITYDGRLVKTVNAGANGKIDTSFTIPSGSRSGSKRVEVKARDSGVEGSSVFVATALTRTITTRTTRIVYDPLAQTFTPNEACFISSLDLIFSKRPVGSKAVIYITKTIAGMPDRNSVIGETSLEEHQVNENNWTTFNFSTPVKLNANEEYAIVVATTDIISSLKVAKLGRYDNTNKRWISKQAFEGGVLLSSSNASTWTPIQDEDMTIKVRKASFSASSVVDLGTVSVVDATDLMLLNAQEIPSDSNITYTAELLDRNNEKYDILPHGPQIIDQYSGRVKLSATLTTSNPASSPRIGEVVQLASGQVAFPSTYVSRNFPVNGTKLKVMLEIKEPTFASILVDYWNGTGWVAMTRASANSINVGNGFVDMPFNATGLTANSTTKVRITLNSTNKSLRPYARKLRAMVSA